MPRPPKHRTVRHVPCNRYFAPEFPGQEIVLQLDELEALRLADLEGLDQYDAAQAMNVSRPTFQRLLASARKVVADALVYGKAIRIEGGPVHVTQRLCRGAHCRHRHCGRSPLDRQD